MRFDSQSGTPIEGGQGCHPLYAALDHIAPGSMAGGFQIVCYDLNDLKGHLPPALFDALRNTPEWQNLMRAWNRQAEEDPDNREAFKTLIKRGVP